MKIEKKKISGSRPLSAAAKSAIATALGMAAAFTLNACDDTVSGGSEEPLGGDVAPEEVIPPASSDSPETANSSSQAEGPASSDQAKSTLSSSSEKIVDIPLSQEPVSSSVAEAISAMMESSSSEVAPTSSDAAPASSAVAPTSSETAPESSSDVTPSSSSNNGWGNPNSSSVDYSEECPDNDPYCINYYFCRDNPSGCMAGSMVTTFERDDITG